MAKFTLTDNVTEVASTTMHASDGKAKAPKAGKRLHLVGVAEQDKQVLKIDSTKPEVVTGKVIALFEDKGGIWTVDLTAQKQGSADIQAKVRGAVVATVAVEVVDQLRLPPENKDEGLLVRLFLAETASPEDPQMKGKWTAEDAKKSMQWMRLVLKNRLQNHPEQFLVRGAKTLQDIVKAPKQFKGFQKYPSIDADISRRIANAFKIANDDDHPQQARYTQFVQAALEVARNPTEIQDPCGSDYFLSGWRTAGHGGPGDDSVNFQALMTNQFFQLKRAK